MVGNRRLGLRTRVCKYLLWTTYVRTLILIYTCFLFSRVSRATTSFKTFDISRPSSTCITIPVAHTKSVSLSLEDDGEVEHECSLGRKQISKQDKVTVSYSPTIQNTERLPQSQANDEDLGISKTVNSLARLLRLESPPRPDKKKSIYSGSNQVRRFTSTSKSSAGSRIFRCAIA